MRTDARDGEYRMDEEHRVNEEYREDEEHRVVEEYREDEVRVRT
ncbi:MAG TPA: hypothetical protein PLO24_05800 [Bacteroidales bacterium]|nr:hypothetical protein [Bacteroidales bacterium]HQH25379.1 hypothetical protein [Bacteroidales bacterium]HQJ82953.1 hypothetical protein [Bacteroidales bacterium]